MALDLPLIWAVLIAVAVLAYVSLDGFDLGVGILYPFMEEERYRDQAMNTIAPFWDGNETWLILGGAGLLAVFPLAYSIIMPALYAPIIAMLFGLIFRGVAFEFRWRTIRWKRKWDLAFFLGSITAAFAQGITLGGLLQGIEVVDRSYAGGWWDWLTPFSVMCGAALVVGYALLGATWMIMKTDGWVNQRCYRLAKLGMLLLAACIGIVSLWTPFLDDMFMDRWFTMPSLLYFSVVPIVILALFAGMWISLRNRQDNRPFFFTLGIFFFCYIGLGISIFPMMVPPSVTIWDAAGPDKSLEFLLVGAVVLLPVIMAYTGYSYWVFRGKTKVGEGYHS